ncbi:efflux RND transporter periplasmic adaptor subunit [Crassaminicella profunda]|uniref:efflux RND transporter periplasmic adaptor subunit n=1 Tax=Crassaminicella profunda TaxID=1286698 RepID=UPI001CA6C5FF|nr:efflux RND transporter periplasmic adaptor subunit [Crassaminicella profunda]QZY55737.1 efflux RND transporter periplasmic adaptor subunit [Crassaminicella profunda]
MKKLWMIFFIISFSSILFIGCGKNIEEVNTEKVEKNTEEIIYVKTEQVGVMDFSSVLSLPGTLKPKDEAIVTGKVNGVVENIYADLGSNVKKEGLLCKIDDTVYGLQYEKEKKGLNSEKLQFENLEKNYERNKALYENKVISQSDFENIEKEYGMAKEHLEITKKNVALAKKNLEDTHIKAPISGIISEKNILKGQNIGPGDQLFKIVNVNQMYATIGVAPKDIFYVKKGQEARIKLDVSQNIFKGKVANIGPEPDGQTKTYPVKILLDNPENKLKSGMFAAVEIIIDTHTSTLAVPKKAVIKENEKSYIFIQKDEKAVKKEVKIGFEKDDYYEIIEAINKGEKVIVVGNEKLEDGSIVKVK